MGGNEVRCCERLPGKVWVGCVDRGVREEGEGFMCVLATMFLHHLQGTTPLQDRRAGGGGAGEMKRDGWSSLDLRMEAGMFCIKLIYYSAPVGIRMQVG